MSIFAYVGLMGHGKTYAVVENVILPKYQAGFNIITNISGLNEEEIKKYILKHNKNYDPANFGTIRFFDGDEPLQDGFFPEEYEIEEIDEKTGKKKTTTKDGLVKCGDLVVIDEAWQYWDDGFDFPKSHIHFFRYMRHFVNDKGHTCDLVVITQDITTLDRQVKRLVEMLFVTNKPKMITQDRFNLTIYEGSSPTRKKMISHGAIPKKYNPEIFPLYKSYSKENAQESLVDGRVNYWKSAQFRYSIVAFFVLVFFGSWYIYSYYKGYKDKAALVQKQQELNEKKIKENLGAKDSTQQSQTPSTGSGVFAPPNSVSQTYKITSVLSADNMFIVGIKDKDNKIRYVNNPQCFGKGNFIACKVDNQMITY